VGRAADSGGLTTFDPTLKGESSACRKSKQSFNSMPFLGTGDQTKSLV